MEKNESSNLAPIESLVGKTILSLSSGNKLGQVAGVTIDPVNGRPLALTLKMEDGSIADLPYDKIYSFGRDAVMAEADDTLRTFAESVDAAGRDAKDLLGTKVVMESGVLLGEIADVLVTLKPPPAVLYEVRRSMLDRLLGRTFFIPASVAYVLSDDAERLLVPDITADIATTEPNEIAGPSVEIRSFPSGIRDDQVEDETFIPEPDEDATVLRRRVPVDDEDDTLIMP